MIFAADEFTFKVPPILSRARRILIKPCSYYPVPYPVTTSANMLWTLISSIRRVSDADIVLIEGTPSGEPIQPIYQTLEYDFPRVLTIDVRDCILVEVDNPLTKPYAVPTFWLPNVILSSDYLITVAPFRVINGWPSLSIMNLLTLLPTSKYHGETPTGWGALYSLGIDKVLADLYFTLPFDLGVIEARQKFTSQDDPAQGEAESYGKIFVGEPYEIDREASNVLGLKPEYLDLIKIAKVDLEA